MHSAGMDDLSTRRWVSATVFMAVLFVGGLAWANGVNPRKTKGNVPVDVECKTKVGTVTVQNAFVDVVEKKAPERAVEFSADDPTATFKIYLVDIKYIDVKPSRANEDFAPATIHFARPWEEKSHGKLRVKKDGKPLFLIGEREVALRSCQSLTVKSRATDRRETPDRGAAAH